MTEAKFEETITRGECRFPVTRFGIPSDPGQPSVGAEPQPSRVEDVFERYGKTPDLARFNGEIGMKGEPILGDMPLPYKMVVDYTPNSGQDIFARTAVRLIDAPYRPKGLAAELFAFCRAAYAFEPAFDARLMCLRDAQVVGQMNGENRMQLTIAPGQASDTHFSNEMDGANAFLDNEASAEALKGFLLASRSHDETMQLSKMHHALIEKHGRKTVGQILYEQGYRLPSFADGVMNNSIRLQLSLLTCDGEFLCATRNEGIGNLVRGDARLDCVIERASPVEFDREGVPTPEEMQAQADARVFKNGFPRALAVQVTRLLRGTLGIRDCTLLLGRESQHVSIDTDVEHHPNVPRVELFCTGFVRNLTLGGQPEFHFMARTGLTTNKAIAHFKAHRAENARFKLGQIVGGEIVAIGLTQVDAAIKSGYLHHSAAMNLALAHKFHQLR